MIIIIDLAGETEDGIVQVTEVHPKTQKKPRPKDEVDRLEPGLQIVPVTSS